MSSLSLGRLVTDDLTALSPDGHAAVIDIGSNSVRLVVYAGLLRTPIPLFNEKVLCGLGSDIETTGRLSRAGSVLALATLRRFNSLLKRMSIDQLDVVATAAVREAADGPEFLRQVRNGIGLDVRVLTGPDEARISALGVLSAIPEAKGLMGDLGGGSLELVRVADGASGEGVTLPLGVLRLRDGGGKNGLRPKRIREALKSIDWLSEIKGDTLYVVGGAWRALGRVHMAQEQHPLRVLHGHAVLRGELESLCNVIAGQSPDSLRNTEGVQKGRLETLPVAAATMAALLRAAQPSQVVFSAYGLREGLLFDRLDADTRNEDPLIAVGRMLAQLSPRFPIHENELVDWLSPLFPDESETDRRLRRAASLLSDMGWRVHPDYRADQAMEEIVRAPVVGVDHRERVRLALAVRARYSHKGAATAAAPYRAMIDDADIAWAQQVGQGLRLAHTLSAGVPGVLAQFQLELRADRILLRVCDGAPEPPEDAISSRLRQLSDAFSRPVLYVPME